MLIVTETYLGYISFFLQTFHESKDLHVESLDGGLGWKKLRKSLGFSTLSDYQIISNNSYTLFICTPPEGTNPQLVFS